MLVVFREGHSRVAVNITHVVQVICNDHRFNGYNCVDVDQPGELCYSTEIELSNKRSVRLALPIDDVLATLAEAGLPYVVPVAKKTRKPRKAAIA